MIEYNYICPVSGGFHGIRDHWTISERYGYDSNNCAYCDGRMWRRKLDTSTGESYSSYDQTCVAWTERFVIEEEPF